MSQRSYRYKGKCHGYCIFFPSMCTHCNRLCICSCADFNLAGAKSCTKECGMEEMIAQLLHLLTSLCDLTCILCPCPVPCYHLLQANAIPVWQQLLASAVPFLAMHLHIDGSPLYEDVQYDAGTTGTKSLSFSTIKVSVDWLWIDWSIQESCLEIHCGVGLLEPNNHS